MTKLQRWRWKLFGPTKAEVKRLVEVTRRFHQGGEVSQEEISFGYDLMECL